MYCLVIIDGSVRSLVMTMMRRRMKCEASAHINECLKRCWPDLRITDDEYKSLQERLLVDDEKSPVDFSQRILTRIFSNANLIKAAGSIVPGGTMFQNIANTSPSMASGPASTITLS